MTQRLTPERLNAAVAGMLAAIEHDDSQAGGSKLRAAAAYALTLADEAKAMERAAAVAWLQDAGTQCMDGDVVQWDERLAGETYKQAAEQIERGDHVRTGTAAADAGESRDE